MRSQVGQAGIGAVLGALLALVGVVLAPDASPTTTSIDGTTSTTSPNQTGPYWHDPHETVLGSVVVVPESLVSEDDGTLVLTYRVEPISPARQGDLLEEDSGPAVAPEVFTIALADGNEVTTAAVQTDSTRVVFDVPASVTPTDVTAIRVDRHWIRMPHESHIELPASRGASFQVDEQIAVSVEAVVEQASGTIVNLGTTRSSSAFIAARNPIVWITGDGPGWRSSIRQSGAGIGGNTGIQLIYTGDPLPDPMPLTISAPQWFPVDVPTALDLGGLNRGR